MERLATMGNYVQYVIENQPIKTKLLLWKAVENNWKKELIGVKNLESYADGEKALFMHPKNTLTIIRLGTDEAETMPAASYQLFKKKATKNV